jgi:hypothetical protein
MSIAKTNTAIFLSFLLALSTTASIAHNFYYHNDDINHNEISNQFVEYGHFHLDHDGHDGHDGHDESGCVFTVIQYSESLLAHEIPAVSLSPIGSKKLPSRVTSQTRAPDNGFFARAPPASV